MVKFLDEVEGIEYPEEMKAMYENLTNEDMENLENFSVGNVKKWIGITDEELLAERKQVFEFMNRMNSDADMQSSWQITFRMTKSMKEQMKNVGYYDKFTENLKVLSSDYCEYTNTRNEFFESLNLNIDEKGKIEVAQ